MEEMPSSPVSDAAESPEEDCSARAINGVNGNANGDLDTLLFLDVDGVLNVGLRDPGNNPVSCSHENLDRAVRMWQDRAAFTTEQRNCVERLVAVHDRELGHGEQSTLAALGSAPPFDLSDVLVNRIANIIRAAGHRRSVILSSSWRRPQHLERMKGLERAIARHLGEPFVFDGKTNLAKEVDPSGRLLAIGAYIQQMQTSATKLRVLVLDDFYITNIGGWSVDGFLVDSVEAAERYIRERPPFAAPALEMSVRVIHTYDEWATPEGLLVQVGTGITKAHLCQACGFLGYGCRLCGRDGTSYVEDFTDKSDSLVELSASAKDLC